MTFRINAKVTYNPPEERIKHKTGLWRERIYRVLDKDWESEVGEVGLTEYLTVGLKSCTHPIRERADLFEVYND